MKKRRRFLTLPLLTDTCRAGDATAPKWFLFGVMMFRFIDDS